MAEPDDPLTGDDEVFVVSDLHMGDGSPRDLFTRVAPRFEAFLDFVAARPGARLVILGDLINFWQGIGGQAFGAHAGLLAKLSALRPLYVLGNHDQALLCFGALPMGTPLTAHMTRELWIDRAGRRILLTHGDRFDRYPDPGRPWWARTGVPTLHRVLERRVLRKLASSRPPGPLARTVDAIGRGACLLIGGLRRLGRWIGDVFGRRPRGESIASDPSARPRTERLLNLSRRTLDRIRAEVAADVVVAAHTHRPGWFDGWLVNAGQWHGEQATYVRIAPDATVTLCAWPGGQELQTSCLDEDA